MSKRRKCATPPEKKKQWQKLLMIKHAAAMLTADCLTAARPQQQAFKIYLQKLHKNNFCFAFSFSFFSVLTYPHFS